VDSKNLAWLKWYSEKARTSVRWAKLSLAEKGLFRELMDIAAGCTPRGSLYSNSEPISNEDLAFILREEAETIAALLDKPMSLKLICRDDNDALYFPDWKRHQRKGPLRLRTPQKGAVGQEWGDDGAQEVDIDIEVEEEVDIDTPTRKALLDWWTPLAKEMKFPVPRKITTKIWDGFRKRLTEGFWEERGKIETEMRRFEQFVHDKKWFGLWWLTKNEDNWQKVTAGHFQKTGTTQKRGEVGYVAKPAGQSYRKSKRLA